MRRLLIVLLAALPMSVTLVVTAPVQAAVPAPLTVPALREWTAATGSYAFTASSRIVVDPAARGLDDEGATFAEDLAALTGITVPVVHDTVGNLRPGDLHLALGSTDAALGDEGYVMAVADSVRIQARGDAGAYYGTRTVLQLLRQARTIPAGTARDWPTKPERGLMIDQGRKFFTVDWVRKHIKELGYLKLNYFHFHLSDTFGFRLESSSHPEIVSPDHYTKAQLADLIALGARHHVTIVPEIDMPGHMNQILAAHPDLQLDKPSGQRDPYFLDLSEPGAYTLTGDLINEYLPLFPSKYWHIGADEYVGDYGQYPQLLAYARANYGANATAKDTYYGFINWAENIVYAAGKTMRMWNDGIKAGDGTINPTARIVVDYWYNIGLTPQQLLDRGHTVSNESWDPTYYVAGGDKIDNPWTYQTWTPDWFQGANLISDPARNLGSKLHVWCDNPNAETEDQIAGGIFLSLRVLAQQTWDSPKLVQPYGDFSPIAATIGHAPGWPVASQPGNRSLYRPVAVSGTETPDFPGPLAVDGDPNTRWSAGFTDPSWIQVDLGSRVPVSRVVIRWEAAYAKAYQIQVSNDAVTWTTIFSTTAGDGGIDDLGDLAGAGRYVRMTATQRATTWLSLWELEVYGGPVRGLSGTYTLSSAGKALDNPASSVDPGKQLVVWSPHGGPNQRWTLSLAADGAYTMVNGISGLCADINGGSTAPGAAVIQWTCHGGDNQRWLVQPTGSTYKILSKKSGLALTGGTADGASATQQSDTAAATQQWVLTPAG